MRAYVSVRNIVTWTSEIAFFMQFGTVNLFLNIQKVVECLQAFVYPFRTGKFSGMFFFKPSLPAIVSFSRYRLYKVFSTITKYLEFLLAFHLPVTDGKKFMEWFFQNFWHSCKYLFMCYGWTPVFFFYIHRNYLHFGRYSIMLAITFCLMVIIIQLLSSNNTS